MNRVLLIVGFGLYWVVLTSVLLAKDSTFDLICAAHCVPLAHFMGFAALAFLCGMVDRSRHFELWMAVLILYGIGTEVLQEWIPPRSFIWGDLFQDIGGIVCGYFGGVMVDSILEQKRQQTGEENETPLQ